MSPYTVELTEKSFEETVTKEGIVFVDCWAEWCGPCRRFAPIYEDAAMRHSDITWGKIDTESEPRLAGALGIRSIPTLMAFRDGILLFAQPGLLPAPTLEKLVEQIRTLDMDEVRREIAEHEKSKDKAAGTA